MPEKADRQLSQLIVYTARPKIKIKKNNYKMKTVEQNKSVQYYPRRQSGGCYSRLWWKRFVEKVSFEPGKEMDLSTIIRL